MELKDNCRHFRGDKPCQYHKSDGWECNDCSAYDPLKERILIIKLGAMGDVIRTTPLLHRIKAEWPRAEIWWVTYHPEVLSECVDIILPFSLESTLILQATPFDIVYNLDKDREACALMNLVSSRHKKGFCLEEGKPAPIDELAVHKFNTGLSDDRNKANKKSYLEEIFEICGFKFSGEEYIVDVKSDIKWRALFEYDKHLIGLNTGCGKRWQTRLWKKEYWIELAKLLRKEKYTVLILGGEQEHGMNSEIAIESEALYLGHYPYNDFVSLVDQCELIVTPITTAMHVAIGLKKKVVAFNSIFNPREFELYGRGELIEPEEPCQCFFQPTCTNYAYCMDTITPERVLSVVKRMIKG